MSPPPPMRTSPRTPESASRHREWLTAPTRHICDDPSASSAPFTCKAQIRPAPGTCGVLRRRKRHGLHRREQREAQGAIRHEEEMEKEMAEIAQRLTVRHTRPRGALVDREGFPIPGVDLYQVRGDRGRYATAHRPRRGHQGAREALSELHLQAGVTKGVAAMELTREAIEKQRRDEDDAMRARARAAAQYGALGRAVFAYVDEVTRDPASTAMRVGDVVLMFGDVVGSHEAGRCPGRGRARRTEDTRWRWVSRGGRTRRRDAATVGGAGAADATCVLAETCVSAFLGRFKNFRRHRSSPQSKNSTLLPLPPERVRGLSLELLAVEALLHLFFFFASAASGLARPNLFLPPSASLLLCRRRLLVVPFSSDFSARSGSSQPPVVGASSPQPPRSSHPPASFLSPPLDAAMISSPLGGDGFASVLPRALHLHDLDDARARSLRFAPLVLRLAPELTPINRDHLLDEAHTLDPLALLRFLPLGSARPPGRRSPLHHPRRPPRRWFPCAPRRLRAAGASFFSIPPSFPASRGPEPAWTDAPPRRQPQARTHSRGSCAARLVGDGTAPHGQLRQVREP